MDAVAEELQHNLAELSTISVALFGLLTGIGGLLWKVFTLHAKIERLDVVMQARFDQHQQALDELRSLMHDRRR